MENTPAQRRIQVVMDFYVPEVHAGMVAYAREAKWVLLDGLCYWPSLLEKYNPQIDGVLAIAAIPPLQNWLLKRDVPVVRALHIHQNLPFPAVEEDPETIGIEAAKHLLTLGHPHFVFHSHEISAETDACWRGFSGFLQAAGARATRLDFRSSAQFSGGRLEADTCRLWLQGELARLPRPLAMLVEDDRFLPDAFQAVEALGWRVPEDIAIMGEGNRQLVLAQFSDSVTSVDTGLWRVGYEAAALLNSILDGESAPIEPIRVPPGAVIARRSTEVYFHEHAGVSAAITYLRQNFRTPVTLESLARKTGVSSRTLQKHFKPATGHSFKEELIRLRLDHVTHLLRETNLKLESVAHEAGFTSAKYLCDAFRKSYGTSPVAYRRLMATGC